MVCQCWYDAATLNSPIEQLAVVTTTNPPPDDDAVVVDSVTVTPAVAAALGEPVKDCKASLYWPADEESAVVTRLNW